MSVISPGEARRKKRKGPKPVRAVRIVDGVIQGPELLTMGEICGLFYARRETIWCWRRRDDDPFPPGVRIGGEVRFERGAVQAWYQRQARA